MRWHTVLLPMCFALALACSNNTFKSTQRSEGARTSTDILNGGPFAPGAGPETPGGSVIDPSTGEPYPSNTFIDPTTGQPFPAGIVVNPSTGQPYPGGLNPGTNHSGISSQIDPQTGQPVGSGVDVQTGKPCTQGDFVNFKYPSNIQSCLNSGKLWDFISGSCTPINTFNASCSWDESISLLNSIDYNNGNGYINEFTKYKNEGAKLAGCARAPNKGVAVFQVVKSAFNKETCDHRGAQIYTLCSVKDMNTVPSSVRGDNNELIKWCLKQQ